jgi:ankyrin repeat protein
LNDDDVSKNKIELDKGSAIIGLKPLHFACARNDHENVTKLLEAKADPIAVNSMGLSPLTIAAEAST